MLRRKKETLKFETEDELRAFLLALEIVGKSLNVSIQEIDNEEKQIILMRSVQVDSGYDLDINQLANKHKTEDE